MRKRDFKNIMDKNGENAVFSFSHNAIYYIIPLTKILLFTSLTESIFFNNPRGKGFKNISGNEAAKKKKFLLSKINFHFLCQIYLVSMRFEFGQVYNFVV